MIDILVGIVNAAVFTALYLASPKPQSILLAQQSLVPPGFIADVVAFALAVALAGRMKALLAPLSRAKLWQALVVLGLASAATGILAYTYAPTLLRLQAMEAQKLGLTAKPVSEEALGLMVTLTAASAAIGLVLGVAVSALVAFIAAKILGAERLGFIEAFSAYSLGQLGGIIGSIASLAVLATSNLGAMFATSRALSTPILLAILVGYAAGLADEGRERRYIASILIPTIIMGAIGLAGYLWFKAFWGGAA